LSIIDGENFRKIHIIPEDKTKENTIPRIGAIKINNTIFTKPAVITTPNPELVTAAPTRPPTSVWEELEGRPNHHVAKFHIMAATKAAAITVRLRTSGFTTPFPIIVATFMGKTVKAIKLKKAAITTAARGDKTFVETTVAIELAES